MSVFKIKVEEYKKIPEIPEFVALPGKYLDKR